MSCKEHLYLFLIQRPLKKGTRDKSRSLLGEFDLNMQFWGYQYCNFGFGFEEGFFLTGPRGSKKELPGRGREVTLCII